MSIASQATLAGDGRKVVTTAGTAVALSATSVPSAEVAITAETDNTGLIAVGTTPVAAIGTQEGIILAAGQPCVIPIGNLSALKIDSTVNGDGVSYVYTA